MIARLMSQHPGGAAGDHELFEGDVTVGRDPGCEIVIDDRTVSRRHARISCAAGACRIEDLGSKNGTWINDRRVRESAELVNGDLVRFGDIGFLFDVASDTTITIPDLTTLSTRETHVAEAAPPAAAAVPEGTVTILFTDIVNSTAIAERLGDHRWLELLRRHNAIVREQTSAHAGYEVKTAGDGFMLAFTGARRGVQCAVAIQRELEEGLRGAEEQVDVRIGLHTGEPLREGDDFFGWHVNLAARIAGAAASGEILVSGLLKELTASGGDIAFGEPREIELKGVSGAQCVFAVSWR